MIDFTHKAYTDYLSALKNSYEEIISFDNYFKNKKGLESFVIIRHDVDRFPSRALKMGKIESEMGISSSYYFRATSYSFDQKIAQSLQKMGHEIGYHYEDLSASNGSIEQALLSFKKNITYMRSFCNINTISMHGSPFSKINNRELWAGETKEKTFKELDILGEAYLDIDYSDIAYVNDTGRNWKGALNNIRDKVISNIAIDLNSGGDLLQALKSKKWKKLVFQIHPERWSGNLFGYLGSLAFDNLSNTAKSILNGIRN